MPEAVIHELDELSKMTGDSKQKLMERALQNLAKKLFIIKANEEYLLLKKNKQAWKELQEEQEAWDVTLSS